MRFNHSSDWPKQEDAQIPGLGGRGRNNGRPDGTLDHSARERLESKDKPSKLPLKSRSKTKAELTGKAASPSPVLRPYLKPAFVYEKVFSTCLPPVKDYG